MNPWEENIGITNHGPLTVPNCFFTAQSGGLSQWLWHSVAGTEGGLVKQDLKLLRGRGGSQRDEPEGHPEGPSYYQDLTNLGNWGPLLEVPAPSNDMEVTQSGAASFSVGLTVESQEVGLICLPDTKSLLSSPNLFKS